jgi:DNA-binding transcriptional MerR regulator
MRPKEVQTALGVSAPTLRAWSGEFAAHLSPGAQSSQTPEGTYTQRRYAASDVAVFRRIKALLDRGLTYEMINEALASDRIGDIIHDEPPTASASIRTDLAIPSADTSAIVGLQEALVRADQALEARAQTIRTLEQLVATQQSLIEELRERPVPSVPNAVPSEKPRVDLKAWWSRMLGA